MVMNKDEAERCLDVSKRKFREGNSAAALKFAKKSLSLHETSEGKDWLSFLEKQASDPSPPSSGLRNRGANSSATNNTTSSSNSDNNSSSSSSKPFTPEQVDGIKQIKSFKAKGDLYGVLGLKKDCSDAEIKKAYRKLALQYHPDKCGAPGADEAFKAIGHAFGVLGDSDKRSAFDRYGIDSDSRASAASSPQFRGFDGAAFEPDISPEELFRMFMGGDAFGDGFPGFAFSAGPGFRTHVYTNGRRRTQPGFARQRQAGGVGDTAWFPYLFQLLPIILLVFMSILSFWTAEEDPFSFERTRTYRDRQETRKHRVTFYVNPHSFFSKYGHSPQKTDQLYQMVEKQYYQRLKIFCAQEKEYQRARIQQSYSIFGVNEKRLKEAKNMHLPHCDELHSWASV